jgi:ABC-type nitrate/sulfonate/bicarbonate transport system substrate-binding protein
VFFLLAALGLRGITATSVAQERKIEKLTAALSGGGPNRVQLWIAKEAGFFAKYGLDVAITREPATPVVVERLVAGDIDLLCTSPLAAATAAANGAPVRIISTIALSPYKLVSAASITSIGQLKGKVLGTTATRGTHDSTTRRLLAKLGLDPDKDVTIRTTAASTAAELMNLMLTGKIDAHLSFSEFIAEAELKGHSVNILADTLEHGILVTAGFVAARPTTHAGKALVIAFLKAMIEATRYAKKESDFTKRVIRAVYGVGENRVVDMIYDSYVLNGAPDRPYPNFSSIEQVIEDLRRAIPGLSVTAKDLVDTTALDAIEKEGFFDLPY